MAIKTISIIGGTGKMGSAFAKAFMDRGYKVIIASRETQITIEEAAKMGDLVIVSVPLKATEGVIKKIGPLVRKDAILSDFTSIKTNPCKLMKKYSNGNVVGGHPLFGPGVEIAGQSIVLCNVRGDAESELEKVYESLGLAVLKKSADEHDKQMAIIQCANQFSNIGFANYLSMEKFDLNKNEMFTPAFQLKLAVVGRMLSQDPGLYPEILLKNPYSKKIISQYMNGLKEIYELIKKKDEKALENKIKDFQDYFGSLIGESREITNKIINQLGKGQ